MLHVLIQFKSVEYIFNNVHQLRLLILLKFSGDESIFFTYIYIFQNYSVYLIYLFI